jgi:hypothetical protein
MFARVIPEPVLPDFDGACLSNLVPVLLAQVARPGTAERTAAVSQVPPWLPAPLTRARQIVLLVLDGLGWEQLTERRALAPTLDQGTGTPITSVAPSTTAAALTSLATGLPPAVHGVVGYRVQVGGEILNILGWRLGGKDARRSIRPREFQPHRSFPGARGPVPVVSRADYGPTGFSAAHLGDAVLHGWHSPSGLVVEVDALLRSRAPFVYAYYDGIDRVAHARGLGEHYASELQAVDRLVADLLSVLPPGAVLAVTADHGQVEVGPTVEVIPAELMTEVQLISGEGRFRWLHVRPGAADDVAAAARQVFGHLAWVRTAAEVVEEGWLGGQPTPTVASRLGDVALVPFEPTAFLDPADTGELRLAARHGSLTSAEMLVPLLAFETTG